MTTKICLASTSRYRLAQLEHMGLSVHTRSPGVDEEEVKARIESPHALVQTLARMKAEAVAAQLPEEIVIGGDQAAVFEGEILGKPGTAEAAIEQLSRLAGQTHELLTAIAVVRGAEVFEHLDVTTLKMRNLTLEELTRYVAFDAPLDCAGAYKLESRGIALFESIESSDHSAIIGLPLIALTSILRSMGVALP